MSLFKNLKLIGLESTLINSSRKIEKDNLPEGINSLILTETFRLASRIVEEIEVNGTSEVQYADTSALENKTNASNLATLYIQHVSTLLSFNELINIIASFDLKGIKVTLNQDGNYSYFCPSALEFLMKERGYLFYDGASDKDMLPSYIIQKKPNLVFKKLMSAKRVNR